MNTEVATRRLYLELLKRTLTFSLWKTVDTPIETYNYVRKRIPRTFVQIVTALLKRWNLQLVRVRTLENDDKQVTEGTIWPHYAHTMVGMKRLNNLQFCIEDVLSKSIEGDLIETGVWRGGASIFMRGVLAAYEVTDRRVFVADSFEGLPKPDVENYPLDAGDALYQASPLAISKEDVADNFQRYGLLDQQVVFLQGWFKDTLPHVPSSKFAVIRLDGDLYQSTIEALENLYPKLSVGGYCIIDDYALYTCQQAVDDYREKHQIKAPLQEIDWTGRFWRKEAD